MFYEYLLFFNVIVGTACSIGFCICCAIRLYPLQEHLGCYWCSYLCRRENELCTFVVDDVGFRMHPGYGGWEFWDLSRALQSSSPSSLCRKCRNCSVLTFSLIEFHYSEYLFERFLSSQSISWYLIMLSCGSDKISGRLSLDVRKDDCFLEFLGRLLF